MKKSGLTPTGTLLAPVPPAAATVFWPFFDITCCFGNYTVLGEMCLANIYTQFERAEQFGTVQRASDEFVWQVRFSPGGAADDHGRGGRAVSSQLCWLPYASDHTPNFVASLYAIVVGRAHSVFVVVGGDDYGCVSI